MREGQVSVYPGKKMYTLADGTITSHVSNRKYVRKLPVCTNEDCRVISERYEAGERLSVIAAEYSMSYARAWAILKRWRERQAAELSCAIEEMSLLEADPDVATVLSETDPDAAVVLLEADPDPPDTRPILENKCLP